MATGESVVNKINTLIDYINRSTGGSSTDLTSAVVNMAASSGSEIISHASIPDYVKAEALEVAKKVNEVREDDSIVFLAMSDSHHTGEQDNTAWQEYTNIGNLHAGMAVKILAYSLDMDFVCHLGDITFGHGTTTSELLHQQIAEMNSWLDEAYKGIPQFRTVGNHDTGYYAYSSGNADMETNNYLFSVFGAYCEGAVYGSEEFGYCYRDFDDKKLRVICLNTSEGDSIIGSGYECSPAQLLWFAQTLRDVGSKSNAADWGIVVLGHYPLDFYGMHDATAVVKAYVEGGSVTRNGTTVNFSGANRAKFIANFHGHTHCFKVAKLNELNTTTMTATEYDAWRVGVPNSAFYRNNHQEGPNAYGLYFEEDTTYDKTIGGAEDTAFVVNVITPSKETIHSFCYGAGYDRTIGYGATIYHTISSTLSSCTMISNVANSIESGKQFTATISPDEHCAIESVTVTMNGINITTSVYSDGVITIPKVTGDVVITAKAAVALACTNQIPISTGTDGSVYGWTIGRLNSSGAVETGSTNSYVTGYIPVKFGDTIYLRNIKFEKVATGSLTTGNQRICFYDANKTFLVLTNSGSTAVFDRVYDGNNLIQITINTESGFDTSSVAYFRINAAYIGDDSIITVNEPIRYADDVYWDIETSLSNVTIDNDTVEVADGESYAATLTVPASHEINMLSITMGGVDITASAYADGVITIESVTGDVVITVIAVEQVVAYTNQLPISTDKDGAVYNGCGYKENTYLSSGNDTTKSGIYTSGFIPINGVQTVYFKNCVIQPNQNYHRIAFYDETKTMIPSAQSNTTQFAANADTTMVWDSNNYLIEFKRDDGYGRKAKFFRFCCSYLGPDSIVTVEEPIE